MKKKRTSVPSGIVARLMFDSDHTCCVCRERGRPVQIHHVDQDPSNHQPSNLSVLCLICHERTQIRGGFSRKLGAAEVVEFRDDWYMRVRRRRDLADQMAASQQSGGLLAREPSTAYEARAREIPEDQALVAYVRSLPRVLGRAYRKARSGWDSGVTANMIQASYELTDVLVGMWVHLSSWYPDGHFGASSPEQYFVSYVAARFRWYRAICEPGGVGSGGSIVTMMAASSVVADVEAAIEQTVVALLEYHEETDDWKAAWGEARRFIPGVAS